jgi:acyl-CoA dehydrogenase
MDQTVRDKVNAVSSKFEPSYWRSVYERRVFPEEYWRSLADAGLFGILVPKRWGGMGRGVTELALATEETARHFAGLGSYLFLSASLIPRVFMAGRGDRTRDTILPKLAKGEIRISVALTEEISGQDASSVGTVAEERSGGFVVNGQKMFVTDADRVDHLLLFAKTASKGGTPGLSMFLVDAKDSAISRERLGKIGIDFVEIFSLSIRDMKVGRDQLVGELGKAWEIMKGIFMTDRILTSASLIGTGLLAIDHAAAYAKKREVFGRKIGSNQGIQFSLANASASLIASEAMMIKAASLCDRGLNFTNEANMALLTSQDSASIATDRALQTFGGHGYITEYDVGRYWKDVRVHRLHPISEEILLSSIATRLLGLPKSY